VLKERWQRVNNCRRHGEWVTSERAVEPYAVNAGNIEHVSTLITTGTDIDEVDSRGWTSLMRASAAITNVITT
jgi:hypothetical protein